MSANLLRLVTKIQENLNLHNYMGLLRTFLSLILLSHLWGCTTSSSPKVSSLSLAPPTPSQPSWSWTPQEAVKAKKVVVEIYHKKQKSGGSGIILEATNQRAYILTTSAWLKNYPLPLLVNVFYQGDHPAQLLYQDAVLTLLSVDGIQTEIPYYLSTELPKVNESVITFGFPQQDKPWTPQSLFYVKTKENKLLFSGQVTQNYYGSPLMKENKVIGMISGQETGMINAVPVETIRNFLKKSIPEAKAILAKHDQRLASMNKIQSVHNTQKSNQLTLNNKTLPTSLSSRKKPLHFSMSVSPLQTVFLSSSLLKGFSPSLTGIRPTIKKEVPRSYEAQMLSKIPTPMQPPNLRKTQTVPMTPNPLAGEQTLLSSLSSSPLQRRTIKRSPPKPFESPMARQARRMAVSPKPESLTSSPTQLGTDDPLVFMNAMCSALETNDTHTFLHITKLLQSNHPLFYLAKNLETAINLNDKKTILQHTIKFLFEAFLLSTRLHYRSSCSQKLIKQKNFELEQVIRTSPSQPNLK